MFGLFQALLVELVDLGVGLLKVLDHGVEAVHEAADLVMLAGFPADAEIAALDLDHAFLEQPDGPVDQPLEEAEDDIGQQAQGDEAQDDALPLAPPQERGGLPVVEFDLQETVDLAPGVVAGVAGGSVLDKRKTLDDRTRARTEDPVRFPSGEHAEEDGPVVGRQESGVFLRPGGGEDPAFGGQDADGADRLGQLLQLMDLGLGVLDAAAFLQ